MAVHPGVWCFRRWLLISAWVRSLRVFARSGIRKDANVGPIERRVARRNSADPSVGELVSRATDLKTFIETIKESAER